MESRAIKTLRQNAFNMKKMEISSHTGETVTITVREIRGLILVDRQTFLKHIEHRSMVERLINRNFLTSYHANGTPKKRRNGKLPNTKTFYDLNNWLDIDYNEALL